MSWLHARIIITLGSDAHIGWRAMGNIVATYPYIPFHIPCYALVPVLVRELGMENRAESYKTVESFLCSHFRCLGLFVEHDGERGAVRLPQERG